MAYSIECLHTVGNFVFLLLTFECGFAYHTMYAVLIKHMSMINSSVLRFISCICGVYTYLSLSFI